MASYKLNHIHVTNPEPKKAAQFYIKGMGAKVTREVSRPDREIIDLDLGGIPIRISSRTGVDDSLGGLQLGLHHLGLHVDDLDKAADEMKSTGVEFVVEPHSPRPGSKSSFIRTPDGVLMEISERKEP